MKMLTVNCLHMNPAIESMATITETMQQVPGNRLVHCPWREYPYHPSVSFRLAHTGDHLILTYQCFEKTTFSKHRTHNAAVYEDSCVEFFISFDDAGYYNLEFNSAGAILAAFGGSKTERTFITEETIQLIRCGSAVTPGKSNTDDYWELIAVIPAPFFCHHPLISFSGIRAKANFYKCGDLLPTPHFITWSPITSASPNFHLPDFFGELYFQ